MRALVMTLSCYGALEIVCVLLLLLFQRCQLIVIGALTHKYYCSCCQRHSTSARQPRNLIIPDNWQLKGLYACMLYMHERACFVYLVHFKQSAQIFVALL